MDFLIGAVVVIVVIAILFFEIAPFDVFRTDEEDIGRNITELKKYQWFQNLLNNEEYKKIIVQDNYVRKTIGKLNTKKLKNKKSNSSYQKKIENMLEQRRNKTDV